MNAKIATNPFFVEKKHVKIKRGKLIVFINEIPRNGYLILSGTARFYSTNADGSEKTVSYLSEGDVLPGEFLLGLSTSALYFCQSVTEMELVEFTCDDFKAEMETNIELVQSLLKTISLSYYGSTVHIEALLQNKAQEKIVQLLRYLVMRFGQKVDGKWMAINIRLTQSDLSEMLGVTRETVAVELGKLKKEDVVDYGSFTYKINTKALADLVDENLWGSFRDEEADI